ncbi:SIR2 family protein [Myxococcus sp. AM011]|uniref:P-loop NTPase n=1 Tax=Myxococcus sp. AM011 TaxID=2745200 RepID=UPI001595793D|nr:SIR2 family protein [Myxococcus sp. AM011]NVJ26159.1 SIR2 family protein [Myxococcus sp. AM011]
MSGTSILPAAIKNQVISAIRRGRYALLLGAGFSASSASKDGRPLPIGNALANEIATAFSLPTGYPLTALASSIPESDLNRHFQERFRHCIPDNKLKHVAHIIWRTIYSFNIDDILSIVYKDPSAQQTPQALTFRHAFIEHSDIKDLNIVHLHGSVEHPDHGYVFSTQTYGQAAALDSSWFKIAADQLLNTPFIIVGCSLNEIDLEYYLARRTGLLVGDQQVAPSLFVTDRMDPVKAALCTRFGLVPIESYAGDFFENLYHIAAPFPSPLELILPAATSSEVFKSKPTETDQRLFFRQWLYVNPAELPKPLHDTMEPHLLTGTEPNWTQLLRGDDVIRSKVTSIVDEISAWAQNSDPTSEIQLISSVPGEGKTSLAMRVGLEAARSGFPVFFYNAIERILTHTATEVFSSIRGKPVIIIDRAGEHGNQIGELLTTLQERKVPFFALLTERTTRLKKISDTISTLKITDHSLNKLNKGEATTLVRKMRDEGLLSLKARQPDNVLAKIITDKDLFTSVILLNSSAPHLNEFIKQELNELPVDTKRVYSLLSLAHSCGYPLKTAVLHRASGLDFPRLKKILAQELHGLVRTIPPLGEYCETRHEIIAEHLIRLISPDERFDAFVSLSRALGHYVNTKTFVRGSPEARLAARLLDFDSTVEPLLGDKSELLYSRIKPDWQWNSRYWNQLAHLKLETDPTTSLRYAEHAVGVETHPVTLTTLAQVRYRLARTHAGTSHGERYLSEAIGAIQQAIQIISNWKRRDIQVYDTGIRGVIEYYKTIPPQRRRIEPRVKRFTDELLLDAPVFFKADHLRDLERRWRILINEIPTK